MKTASVSNVTSTSKQPEAFSANLSSILFVVGQSFVFLWFFESLLAPPFFHTVADVNFSPDFQIITFVVALVLTYVAIRLLSSKVSMHKATLACFVFFLILVETTIVFLVYETNMQEMSKTVHFIAGIVCMMISGACVASLLILYLDFYCIHLRKSVRTYLQYALVLAFFWNIVLSAFNMEIARVIATIFALIAPILYLVIYQKWLHNDNSTSISPSTSDMRMQVSRESWLLSFIGSLAQGFALSVLALFQFDSVFNAAMSCALLLMALITSISIKGRFIMDEKMVQRIMIPVVILGFILLLVVPYQYTVWPCGLIFTFSIAPYILSASAICEHITRFRLAPIRTLSIARIVTGLGLLAGVACGWISETELLSDWTGQIIIIAICLLFTVSWVFLFDVRSHYPGESDASTTAVSESNASRPLDGEDFKQFHHQRCMALAERYGLTKRQQEVMELLSRGRNSTYIQKELVISSNTVKSHMYTIYQKMGVHSQQELIELVEMYTLDT